MTILDQIRHIPDGIKHISDWLGDGGEVVRKTDAQARADVCNRGFNGERCPFNARGVKMSTPVALAIKRHLEVKNSLNLRVEGEKQLGTCEACGCSLRLLVWQTQDRIRLQTDGEHLPAECWKLK